MKKVTTVKHALLYLLHNVMSIKNNQVKGKAYFICNGLDYMYHDCVIDDEIYKKVCQLLIDNKPNENNSFSRYTESKYWTGGYCWWKLTNWTKRHNQRAYILSIKKQYIIELMASIK